MHPHSITVATPFLDDLGHNLIIHSLYPASSSPSQFRGVRWEASSTNQIPSVALCCLRIGSGALAGREWLHFFPNLSLGALVLGPDSL